MKRLLLIAGLIGLSAFMLLAADASGKWKGSFDFNGNAVPLTITLKVDGDKVTGSVEGLPSDTAEIKEGKLADDTLTFFVMTDYQGMPIKLVYKGKVAADQITFTFGTEDGAFSADLITKRS